jgi:hypothetical protein
MSWPSGAATAWRIGQVVEDLYEVREEITTGGMGVLEPGLGGQNVLKSAVVPIRKRDPRIPELLAAVTMKPSSTCPVSPSLQPPNWPQRSAKRCNPHILRPAVTTSLDVARTQSSHVTSDDRLAHQ